ncbi:hypothetical protein NK211_13105 [Mammaliicoccus sciuri]|uniref:hypothetical protein n=1 Tax=Mammaliicoccus sciuri TaxID=1296 RepID=UPI00209FAF9D|nr:hypothetical protein [Mammaliicoccus sciuri]MCP1288317.1 hypothetical protein [Mammaliicoccus sciuri]
MTKYVLIFNNDPIAVGDKWHVEDVKQWEIYYGATNDMFEIKKFDDYYKHYDKNYVAPIDYEDTQAYKDNEPWFTGMGRC